MTFNHVPDGAFMMGSPEHETGRNNDEGQRWVILSKPFRMGTHEVTQAQYQAVMGNNPSHFKGGNLPVEMVSWHDAVEFCRRLSARTGYRARLPTEAEWEYACRAGTPTAFHTGVDAIQPNQANISGRQTVPVGSYPANAFGLFDMHGNVWEWCADWYANYEDKTFDPQGPANGQHRVLRGGSWYDINQMDLCRSARRYNHHPDDRYAAVGFRVVLD